MIRSRLPALLLAFLPALATASATAGPPIAVHPENPRYFLWRGRPTVLVTGGEHYGSVINPDFDCRLYLATPRFTGSYDGGGGAALRVRRAGV